MLQEELATGRSVASRILIATQRLQPLESADGLTAVPVHGLVRVVRKRQHSIIREQGIFKFRGHCVKVNDDASGMFDKLFVIVAQIFARNIRCGKKYPGTEQKNGLYLAVSLSGLREGLTARWFTHPNKCCSFIYKH
jgi:hypothetical protein